MSLVADTGPLIALAKVDRLELLEQLFGQVTIAPSVYRELLAKVGPEADRLDRALATFIRVSGDPMPTPEVMVATERLDRGERDTVALAVTMGLPLLMDDQLGRRAGRQLGVGVIGVAGLVLQGKRRGLVQQVGPILEELRSRGYWLSEELVVVVARLAGEL